jgi:hypothetical protein
VTGVPLIVGAPFAGAELVTVIVNAASDALAEPSVAVMTMFPDVPAAVGVPLSCPVVVLKLAHAGWLLIEKRSGSLSGSLAEGVKLYVEPTMTDAGGVPEIVGAEFDRDCARIENAGSAVVLTPSLTLIWMLVQKPTLPGVPLSRPLPVLKLAHAGLFAIEKRSFLRSGSDALGRKEYEEPT